MRRSLKVEFLGPLDLYVTREDDGWLAAVDPFSVFGEGATEDEAVGDALDGMVRQLGALAEEIVRHQRDDVNVQILCPLSDKWKQNYVSKHEFVIVGFYTVAPKKRTKPARSRVASRKRRIRAARPQKLTPGRLKSLFEKDAEMQILNPESAYAAAAR